VNSTGEIAGEFLAVVAAANEQLIDLAVKLRLRPEVKGVVCDMDCRRYGTTPRIEYYVDAELRNGRAISWGMEVGFDGETWSVEADVRVQHEQGQDLLREWSPIHAVDLSELTSAMSSAVDTLVRVALESDLLSMSKVV